MQSRLAVLLKATRDAAMLARPLSSKEQFVLERFKSYVSDAEFKLITKLAKQKKVELDVQKQDFSVFMSGKNLLPQLNPDFGNLNKMIRRHYYEEAYTDFSSRAWEVLPQFIAPKIIGLRPEKKAAVLQLFAKKKLHILYLGDPGTGKTQILRYANKLASISSYGLGSGTSGAGLSVAFRGDKEMLGLLPAANDGVCCIDELNLMKKEDRANLLNAMEEGFVSYDKAGKHKKFDARVRILATANPKGDKFEKYTKTQIKKQLPFDPALLSRFNLIFIVKKASLDTFSEIVNKMVTDEESSVSDGDIAFIRDYIDYAMRITPSVPKDLAQKVKDFSVRLKKNEKDLLYEVTPRTVEGVLEMLKASARIDLRGKVNNVDLARVFELVESSGKI